VSAQIDRARAEAIVDAHTALLGWRAEIPAVRSARDLIGRAGSRWQVPTPAALIDLDALVDNVNAMQSRVDANGIDLWPHAKTHKCAAVAEIQMAAGATRICTAKLGEAEALADSSRRTPAAPTPLMVTSPLATTSVIERACDLAARHGDIYVVVDHLDHVSLLAEAANARGVRLGVLVDLDVGLGRTGATSPAAATAIATCIAESPSLTFIGVQGYGGHWQHLAGATQRHSAVAEGMLRLTDACNAISAAGLNTRVRTGGGTGTVTADLELSVLNAVQPGSYIAMDRQYIEALGTDVDGQFRTALTVAATVVSANQPGYVTVDAGFKAMATDASAPTPVNSPGSTFMFYGDEHGLIASAGESSRSTSSPSTFSPSTWPLLPGSRVEFVSPHCDPTIDRYDVLHVVSGDTLIAVVAVDARGRSQ
jgi:D-serine deaminase-like pyridoxal phosphate-dependent protein